MKTCELLCNLWEKIMYSLPRHKEMEIRTHDVGGRIRSSGQKTIQGHFNKISHMYR